MPSESSSPITKPCETANCIFICKVKSSMTFTNNNNQSDKS